MKKEHMILIGGLPESLINFRGDLLNDLRSKFDNITSMSAPAPEQVKQKLKALDVEHYDLCLRRNALNPIHDSILFIGLIRIFKLCTPNIVLAYTIKPIIWGGLAARFTKTEFVALVTGLGFAFHGATFGRRLLRKLVTCLYKEALSKAKTVIFQNKDNAELFVKLGIVSREKIVVVDGSGVNIDKFPFCPIPRTQKGELVFLCVARLLRDKGLVEYAEAARIVKERFPKVSVRLVGPLDPSPDGIALSQIKEWKSLDYLGETSDVRPFLKESDVYVLPSYHEGLPRSTLEAMSMGRPVITTNAVGCKETVVDGWNGYKVDVADANQLAEKMIWCIKNHDKLEQMGKNSRSLVEERFDVRVVNAEIMKALGVAS